MIGSDHDRQHDDRGEVARCRLESRRPEERDEAERRVESRLDVVAQKRSEDEDAPETDDDARDRRERLDERRDRARGASVGDSSVRKSAMPSASGVARSSAPNDVTTVP